MQISISLFLDFCRVWAGLRSGKKELKKTSNPVVSDWIREKNGEMEKAYRENDQSKRRQTLTRSADGWNALCRCFLKTLCLLCQWLSPDRSLRQWWAGGRLYALCRKIWVP